MNNTRPDDKPYETQAMQATTTGWCCKTCKRYYGVDETARHCASYCCCTSRPCSTEGCEGRAEKHYTACKPCIEVADRRRYASLPRKEWDGVTPLSDDSGNFFWSSDEVESYLEECEEEGNPPILFYTDEDSPARSDLVYRHLEDYGCGMDDDFDMPDTTEIDKIVEDWLAKNVRKCYTQSRTVPTWESVLAHTGFTPASWP